MSDQTWDPTGDAREALRRIVADFGAPALSNPQVMGNGLDDQLPNAPEKQRNILVGASKAGVPASLQEHVTRGMDPDHAVRLTASRLAEKAGFEDTACLWATSEFARALGYQVSDDAAPVTAPPAGSFSAKSEETLLPPVSPYPAMGPGGVPPVYGPAVNGSAPPGGSSPSSGIGRVTGGRVPGGASGKSVAAVVAVVVVCLIGVVVARQFPWNTPSPPVSIVTTQPTVPPATTEPTVPPASGPLDLMHNRPVFLTSNGSCNNLRNFSSLNATQETICKLTNPNVSEDFVIYDQFSDKSHEQDYYQELLALNGMQTRSGGDCAISPPPPRFGSPGYCAAGYLDPSGRYGGNFFILGGTKAFPIGRGYTVSATCGNNPTSVGVVGFSDDANYVVGIAFSCDNSYNQVENILQDFKKSRLDVGSMVTG